MRLDSSGIEQQLFQSLRGVTWRPFGIDGVPLRSILRDLVRQAEGCVFERQPLPAAFLHLLERRAIPELVPLNQRIRQDPASTADEQLTFLSEADGLGFYPAPTRPSSPQLWSSSWWPPASG